MPLPHALTEKESTMQMTDFDATVFDGTNNAEKVPVTFSMALNVFLRGHMATLILMVKAVELGKPDGTAGMDIGKPFEPSPIYWPNTSKKVGASPSAAPA